MDVCCREAQKVAASSIDQPANMLLVSVRDDVSEKEVQCSLTLNVMGNNERQVILRDIHTCYSRQLPPGTLVVNTCCMSCIGFAVHVRRYQQKQDTR